MTMTTDRQIRALLAEQDGSDLLMAAICQRALGELDADAIAHYSHPGDIARAVTMTPAEARIQCARVTADAEAMHAS